VAGTIARLRAFNAGQSLAGLSWQYPFRGRDGSERTLAQLNP
jgi:hypothetical protein